VADQDETLDREGAGGKLNTALGPPHRSLTRSTRSLDP